MILFGTNDYLFNETYNEGALLPVMGALQDANPMGLQASLSVPGDTPCQTSPDRDRALPLQLPALDH